MVPFLYAGCPKGMYCPAEVNCDVNSTMCKPSVCLSAGNSTKDCQEGIIVDTL